MRKLMIRSFIVLIVTLLTMACPDGSTDDGIDPMVFIALQNQNQNRNTDSRVVAAEYRGNWGEGFDILRTTSNQLTYVFTDKNYKAWTVGNELWVEADLSEFRTKPAGSGMVEGRLGTFPTTDSITLNNSMPYPDAGYPVLPRRP